jgi:hypothetical protein
MRLYAYGSLQIKFGPNIQTCRWINQQTIQTKMFHVIAHGHQMLEFETLYELFVKFRGPDMCRCICDWLLDQGTLEKISPFCNQLICDYTWLITTCSLLLVIFVIIFKFNDFESFLWLYYEQLLVHPSKKMISKIIFIQEQPFMSHSLQ